MSVVKQVCINRLELPKEICDIVKSFAFYDKIVYQSMQRKSIICGLIRDTSWSRNGNSKDDSDGHWCFWIEEDPLFPQMQAWNCIKCGEYSLYHDEDVIHPSVLFSQRIECNCEIDNI
jgi:hypothetical protein